MTALMRLSGQSESSIRDLTLELLDAEVHSEQMYSRDVQQLSKLEEALKQWSSTGQHGQVMIALRERLTMICGKVGPESRAALNFCDHPLVQR